MGTRDQIEHLQTRIKKRSGLSNEPPEDENTSANTNERVEDGDVPTISEDDAEVLLEFSRQLDLL